MMSLEFSFKDFLQVMIPKPPLWLIRMILIVAAISIIAIMISYTIVHSAEYATYMKVVGFNGAYVQVVDTDGEQWEIECIERVVKDKQLKKGMDVLVIMDLRYDTDKHMFGIGYSHIDNIL